MAFTFSLIAGLPTGHCLPTLLHSKHTLATLHTLDSSDHRTYHTYCFHASASSVLRYFPSPREVESRSIRLYVQDLSGLYMFPPKYYSRYLDSDLQQGVVMLSCVCARVCEHLILSSRTACLIETGFHVMICSILVCIICTYVAHTDLYDLGHADHYMSVPRIQLDVFGYSFNPLDSRPSPCLPPHFGGKNNGFI